jgi:putative ABC transport system permease protein
MFQRNFLLAFRNFKRNKTSFFINLIGLSTGLACALLIYLWVNDELHVDKFYENNSQLYQVMNNLNTQQGIQTGNYTPAPLAEALAKEMPEVEYAVAVNDFFSWNNKEGILSNGDNHIKSKGIHASKDYFNVFSYKLIQGDKKQVLADKNCIVISEELAKKLFNTTDNIIGKSLEWNFPFFKGIYQVSGVFKNTPTNSTTQFDVIFSMDVLLATDQEANKWTGNYAETYLILKKGTNIDHFDKKIAGFLKSKFPPFGDLFTLFVQQYSNKYLYGKYENGIPVGGRIAYVRLFSVIAIFILLIACINFMNLSTARASRRAKEVGIKKAIGSSLEALIVQFLLESMLITFLSLIIALILVELLLPQFNSITSKSLNLTFNTSLTLSIFGITLITSLVSGSYPAFYLSGFNPTTVLKGKLNTSIGELWVRKGLVIFQFALSVIFIVGLLIINNQIEFTQTKNLGYNRENIVCFKWIGKIWSGDDVNKDLALFLAESKNTPGVVMATNMSGNILNEIYGQSGMSWNGQEENKNYLFQSPIVGYDFIETLGLKIVEGRSFSKDYNEDLNVIINEAALKMMGMKNPIGMKIRDDMTIIGVVKDFNYGSLHNKVEPLILRFNQNGQNILVKIKTGTEMATIERLKQFYKKFFPTYPFEFTFMDADYQALYKSESKVADLSKYFAGIAIIISCLGLFGLAAFTVIRKRKGIGIRKVFGSSAFNIVYLLSGDFTKQVIVSILIGLPVSFLIARDWLNSFAYRINLEWWFFIVPGLIVIFIAWFTVGMYVLNVANANPVQCLRDE